jgi:hypothetical protein
MIVILTGIAGMIGKGYYPLNGLLIAVQSSLMSFINIGTGKGGSRENMILMEKEFDF